MANLFFIAKVNMASVWIWMIVLIFIQNAFAEVKSTASIFNCDECVRNGGQWCKKPANPRCNSHKLDKWCSDVEQTQIKDGKVTERIKKGMYLSLTYTERTVDVDKIKKVAIRHTDASSVIPKTSAIIWNSTQSYDVKLDIETTCKSSACKTIICATPRRNFCLSNGTSDEYFYARITVENVTEEAYIKYNVPCACECSKHAEEKSLICNGKGEYSCGICKCESGWTGRYCQVPDCEKQRQGKILCSKDNYTECFGNGYCNECNICDCYTGTEGSQYFDELNNCKDICTITSECSSCLDNSSLGKCSECPHPITIQSYNDTISSQRDTYNRSVWVTCKSTGDYCEYVTMKTEIGDIYIMVKPCNVIAAGQTSTMKDDYTDLCMITSDCSSCLYNNTFGKCSECPHPITTLSYNETISSQRDNYNRSLWETCYFISDNCDYLTMQTESGDIYVMVKPCSDNFGEQTSTIKYDYRDLCMITSDCSSCLRNNSIGKCSECLQPITTLSYNETISSQRDIHNRSVWVTCNATGDYCEYVTMQTESGDIYVMVKPCHVIAAVANHYLTIKVPTVLGVLGIVAAVAAIGGVMLWKLLKNASDKPTTKAHFQNLDAKDYSRNNPLYMSPQSTFNNPLYKKNF